MGSRSASSLCALALAAGCTTDSRPIDLTESRIETSAEGYRVFSDITLARLSARALAEGCDRVELDELAVVRYEGWLDAEIARLAREQPDLLESIVARFGLPLEAIRGGGPEIDADFLLRNPGLTFDFGGRIAGEMFRQGSAPDCEDAARVMARSGLVGWFLRPAGSSGSG